MTTIKEAEERIAAGNCEFWWLEASIPRDLVEMVEAWAKAHEKHPDVLIAYLIASWIERNCEVA